MAVLFAEPNGSTWSFLWAKGDGEWEFEERARGAQTRAPAHQEWGKLAVLVLWCVWTYCSSSSLTVILCCLLISVACCAFPAKIFPLVPLFAGSEMCDRIKGSSESSGGWGWGAAHPQTDGHGWKRTSADGGGGSAARQCCRCRGSNRIKGGRQWVNNCVPVWKSHIVTESYWVSMLPSCHCLFAARAQAAELRFSQLKERHAELITSHAGLMKKVTCPQYCCLFYSIIQKDVGNTLPHCLTELIKKDRRHPLFCNHGLVSIASESLAVSGLAQMSSHHRPSRLPDFAGIVGSLRVNNIRSHPDILWLVFCVSVQNADTVKMLSNTKQDQDDLLRAKQQLEKELECLQQEKRNLVRRTVKPSHSNW